MTESDSPLLFIPGPVEVDRELRDIMSMPLIGHRSKPFVAEVTAVCDKLKALYLTSAYALFENCPATALMEAGVRNLVARRVLHLTCGAFSERWLKISRACGREAEAVAVDWGQPSTPDDLRRALLENGPFDAVAITHNETSTGVINPLAELAATVREIAPDTLIMVDAVTSVGGAELRFDDWGLDLAFAGTQKCLALPPGLCVYAVSERAMAIAREMPGRGYLLDFANAAKGLPMARPRRRHACRWCSRCRDSWTASRRVAWKRAGAGTARCRSRSRPGRRTRASNSSSTRRSAPPP